MVFTVTPDRIRTVKNHFGMLPVTLGRQPVKSGGSRSPSMTYFD